MGQAGFTVVYRDDAPASTSQAGIPGMSHRCAHHHRLKSQALTAQASLELVAEDDSDPLILLQLSPNGI